MSSLIKRSWHPAQVVICYIYCQQWDRDIWEQQFVSLVQLIAAVSLTSQPESWKRFVQALALHSCSSNASMALSANPLPPLRLQLRDLLLSPPCYQLLLILLLPCSLAQTVETKQGTIIGQRSTRVNTYGTIKTYDFQNIFHWFPVQSFCCLRLLLLSSFCRASSW